MKRIAACFVLLAPLSGAARAEEDFNTSGRLGYALWDCAAHGFLMKDVPESTEALFNSGLEKIGAFIQAANDGKLTKENTKDVPIGLSWYFVPGPSVDFSLGYMWAKFSEHAYEETWPNFGEPSFDEQKEIQQLRAMQAYQDKNCALLAQ